MEKGGSYSPPGLRLSINSDKHTDQSGNEVLRDYKDSLSKASAKPQPMGFAKVDPIKDCTIRYAKPQTEVEGKILWSIRGSPPQTWEINHEISFIKDTKT